MNQYGEVSENYVIGDEQEFADTLPPKTGVEAIEPLDGGAVLADVIAKVNAILAALKDTTTP